MPSTESTEQLDEILALQLTLAWAGEAAGGPHPRLGWWRTDLVDPEAGGDLWARLLPRMLAAQFLDPVGALEVLKAASNGAAVRPHG